MTGVDSIELGNPNFLVRQLDQLQQLVQDSARKGRPIREFETQLLATLMSIGHDGVAAYLKLQGDGDLGSSIAPPAHDPQRRTASSRTSHAPR